MLQVNKLRFLLLDIIQQRLLLVLNKLRSLWQGGRSGLDHVVVPLNLLYTHARLTQTFQKYQPADLLLTV
ncbi:hypothetical protein D3C74_477380 [compost metagenome]